MRNCFGSANGTRSGTKVSQSRLAVRNAGRMDQPLAVHHTYYEFRVLPWNYPDHVFNRDADEDREEETRDAKKY